MEGTSIVDLSALWANTVLVWIGFGTLVGLAAKAIMPGRDPGGALITLIMGICGCVIGCGMLSYFLKETRVTPISPIGFVVGTGGAFFLLSFYRLLAGYYFVEGGEVKRRPTKSRRKIIFQDEEPAGAAGR